MNDHVDLTNLRIDGKLDSIPAKSRSGVSKWLSKRLLIGAALLALLGFGADYGWHYWEVGRFQESTDDAYVQTDSTIVAPRVSGYLREVFVADNQMVRAHQPLAKIDDRDYAITLKQATANVDGARATIDNIRASIEQQQPTIEQVRSTAVLDQANLTFAQQEHDRYTKLANQGSGSVQNAQQAVSKLDVAKATLERDGAAVLSAEKQIHVLKAQLTKAEAALVHEQAAAEQAQLNLSYTDIVAPVEGVIGNRTLRIGEYVQAGTGLLSIVPLSAVYVVANFKETQLTDVHPGQPVEIEIDSFPDHALKGTVDSIAPASGQTFALLPPDNATGNFTKIVQRVPVKIRITGNNSLEGILLPGMSVVPTIDTRANADKPAK